MRATVPTREPRVATADLEAALDEHDAEPPVAAQTRSRSARGSAARRCAAAAPRWGTARFRAGTSGNVFRPSVPRYRAWPTRAAVGTDRGAQFARAESGRSCRGLRSRPRPESSARARRTPRAASANCPRLPEQPGELAALAQRDHRREAQPEPRRPRHRRRIALRATSAAGWRASARRSRSGPTGIRNADGTTLGSCGSANSVQRSRASRGGRRRGTGRTTRPRRRRRGSDRACRPRAAATPQPARHLDHQHAQRDRDAEPPVEHVVEERVGRVAVVDGVPGEPAVGKERAGHFRRGRRPQSACELVELHQPRFHVEVRVRVQRRSATRLRRAGSLLRAGAPSRRSARSRRASNTRLRRQRRLKSSVTTTSSVSPSRTRTTIVQSPGNGMLYCGAK